MLNFLLRSHKAKIKVLSELTSCSEFWRKNLLPGLFLLVELNPLVSSLHFLAGSQHLEAVLGFFPCSSSIFKPETLFQLLLLPRIFLTSSFIAHCSTEKTHHFDLFFNYILLFMLLKLSQCFPLAPSTQLPYSLRQSPHLCPCSWQHY